MGLRAGADPYAICNTRLGMLYVGGSLPGGTPWYPLASTLRAHLLSEPVVDSVRMRDRDYWVLLHSEQIGLKGGGMETRVTLRPGEKGTKALVAEHGDRLICVRYRYDAAARVRYKTVELVVEQVRWEPGERGADSGRRPGRPPCLVGVRVAYQDRALQQRIRKEGGRWVRKLSLWVLPLAAAKRLKLEDRLVPVPDAIDPAPRGLS
jgi:hypothetical protein